MPHNRSSILEVQELSKRFGSGPPVLHELSLELQEHEFISIIGKSGCGKSTLLNILAGLITKSGGSIAAGKEGDPLLQKDIAYVFQDPTLLPWATVFQNVRLPGKLRRYPASELDERVESLIRFVGLENSRMLYPGELSGGMKMRTSIARALTLTPRLLLLDEPFGALDAMTRNQLNEDLLALFSRDRWSALFVTHSVNEAVFLSSRVLIMSNQPGTVFREIPVELPYPRTQQTRESTEYQNKVVEVFQALKETHQ